MEHAHTRRLDWEACYNARDLGGHPTRDGRRTRWRSVLRSDNLRRLTARGAATLVTDGVRTIIDLRSPFELRIDPCPFARPGQQPRAPIYANLPVLNQEDETLDEALNACRSVTQMYGLLLEHCRHQLAAIVTAVAAAPVGGVLVYCHAGKDRTGPVAALVLAVAGVPNDAIAADYALSDRYLQPLYESQLQRIADPAERARLAEQLNSPLNATAPGTMLETLAHLETVYGGAHDYLRGAGVGARDLAHVASRLRE